MPSYIAIQSTYNSFEMALFLNDICVGHIQEDKRYTSKLFIPLLEKLLVSNSVSLHDLDFCAVNCGPGPFSTLRSVIASVNGLHLGMGIPLIGIDGLEATFLESYDPNYENTVVLLNAFNHEVYYLLADKGKIVATGYKKIDDLLKELLTKFSNRARSDPSTSSGVNTRLASEALCEGRLEEYPRALEEILQQVQDERRTKDIKQNSLQRPMHFLGNGVTLYHDLIKQVLGQRAIISPDNPTMCSVKMIGGLGLEKWRHNGDQKEEYLMPLYLKKHAVEL